MSELLSWFQFYGIEISLAMYLAATVIWLIVLACAVSSIVTRPMPVTQRVVWMLVVILLPVLGLLVYLPFSCRKEEYAPILAMMSGCIPKDRS